jgi:hypothetical protein
MMAATQAALSSVKLSNAAPNQLILISGPPNAARAPESVTAPATGCIAGEMPSAVIAAAEVAAVITGSIAVLTEVVTDIDVLSN